MNNDDLKKIADEALSVGRTFADGVSTVGRALADYAAEQRDLSSAKAKLATAQINAAYHQMACNNLWPDYNNVANAVGECLSVYHGQCGLCCPHSAVDVYCNDVNMRIVPGPQPTFRYEIERKTSDLYLGGMKKLECPRVPKEDIEQKLAQVLPKYVNKHGYGYSGLSVTDHQDNSVIIELNGIYYL